MGAPYSSSQAPAGTPGVTSGMHIPYMAPKSIMTSKRGNMLIAIANALMRTKIARAGSADQMLFADNGFLLQLANSADSGFILDFRGEYNTRQTTNYLPGDCVRVSPGNELVLNGVPEPILLDYTFGLNARAGTFVCLQKHTPYVVGGGDLQQWPQYPDVALPKICYWQLLSDLEHAPRDYVPDPIASEDGPIYIVDDLVQLSPNNPSVSGATPAGTYICIQDDPSPAQFPVSPQAPPLAPGFDYPGRAYWKMISRWPDNGKGSFQGVYVPGSSYGALDEVVVQRGAAAGEYISTADNNTNAPITGINWIQLSALPQWF